MKSLQTQYNLIKEGKGSKSIFITEAKKQYPNYIRNAASFDETVKSLSNRNIIAENYMDLEPMTIGHATKEDSFTTKFKAFLKEEAKAEEKKVTKEVEEVLDNSYSKEEKKKDTVAKLDDQISHMVTKGIYFEAKQNPDKNLDEIRDIVSKNLEKDALHYMKHLHGVEGLEAVQEECEEATGKHASSGYGEKTKALKLNESLMEATYEVDKDDVDDIKDKVDDEDTVKVTEEEVEEKPTKKSNKKMKKSKVPSLESMLADIDNQSNVVALEAKIDKIDELIEAKSQRLDMVAEDDNLSELVDKSKIKAMQKEIKLFEKQKAKLEKLYEKTCGKAYVKQEVVGEVDNEEAL